MRQYTDNAKQFTMDGGFNAYDFKDDEEPGDNVDYKSLIGGSAEGTGGKGRMRDSPILEENRLQAHAR